jgi:hypothetical protein
MAVSQYPIISNRDVLPEVKEQGFAALSAANPLR